MVSREKLLDCLPPFRDEWITLSSDQTVDTIISEVLSSHKYFAPYYDKIALYFDVGSIQKICNTLYRFCKQNFEYVEETEESQTTSVPSGLLERGHCDCKGYATFCAGVLDAIKRSTGNPIDWYYRFASYKNGDRVPHHVFTVVKTATGEIWIDPTPGATDKDPSWIIDKTVKTTNEMPLLRNIAGIGMIAAEDYNFAAPSDSGGILVDSGGSGGTDVVPAPVETTFIVSEPVTADENLSAETLSAIDILLRYGVLDSEGNVSDENLFALMSQLPAEEYQLISQARYKVDQQIIGGLFSNIWRGIKKVSLVGPRNAYLSLVALNIFGTATKVAQAITTDAGRQQLGDKWYKLGGNPDALFNAARSGAKKNRIGSGEIYIPPLTTSTSSGGTIGVAPIIPAWVAAASAIIAALTPLINSILRSQQTQNVPVIPGYDPNLKNTNGFGATDPLEWVKSHPLETAAIGLLGIFVIKKLSKRGAA
jgi:hypothetical protein